MPCIYKLVVVYKISAERGNSGGAHIIAVTIDTMVTLVTRTTVVIKVTMQGLQDPEDEGNTIV
jgi:hypothetical protein